MKTGDWINLATASGVAITALFTFLGFLVVRQRAKIDQPVINHQLAGKRGADMRTLSLTIAPPDNTRYTLKKVRVLRPRSARLSHPFVKQDTYGQEVPGEPDEWKRSLTFERDSVHSTGVYLRTSPGEPVSIRVTIALRADSRIASRRVIHTRMPD